MTGNDLMRVLLKRTRACETLGVSICKYPDGTGWFAYGANELIAVSSSSGEEMATRFRRWMRGAAEEHCAELGIAYGIGTADQLAALDSILDAIEKHEGEARR